MDSTYTVFLFLFLASISFLQIDAKRDYSIIMDSYTCTSSPDFVKYSNCSIDKSANPAKGHIEIQMQRELKTLKIDLVLSLENPKNKKKRNLINVTNIDACDIFSGKDSLMKVLAIYKSILLEFGKLPTKCPVPKDYLFLYKDMVIDSEKFPPFIPETGFVIYVRVLTQNQFLCNVELRGTVTRKHFYVEDKKIIG